MFYFIKLVTIREQEQSEMVTSCIQTQVYVNVVINMAIVSTGMDIKYTLVLLYINMFNCSFY